MKTYKHKTQSTRNSTATHSPTASWWSAGSVPAYLL